MVLKNNYARRLPAAFLCVLFFFYRPFYRGSMFRARLLRRGRTIDAPLGPLWELRVRQQALTWFAIHYLQRRQNLLHGFLLWRKQVRAHPGWLWSRYFVLRAWYGVEWHCWSRHFYRRRWRVFLAPVGPTPFRLVPGIAYMPTIENFKTGYETTLTADPGTSGTSLAVTTRTGSPPSGEFYLLIQDSETSKTNREWVRVTAGNGTGAGSFTVVRGLEGSSGVAHAIGSYAAQVITDTGLSPIPSTINPLRDPYNCVGDGITDDYTNLNTAFTDAGTTGRPIVCPPGFTFLVGTTLTLGTANVLADFGGCTIKKPAAMTTDAFNITANGVELRYLNQNGARGVSEVQQLTAGTGTYSYTLSFGGNTTTTLTNTSDQVAVAAALTALASIGANNAVVKGTGATRVAPFVITFVGTKAKANQAQITVNTVSGTPGTMSTLVNGAAGASGGGITISGGTTASPVVLRNVVSKSNEANGVNVTAGVLNAYSSAANDNSTAGASFGLRIGWKFDAGTITMNDCDANNNEYCGYRFWSAVNDGCFLTACRSFQSALSSDGYTVGPNGFGCYINNNRGIMDSFRAIDDTTQGVILESLSSTNAVNAAEWEIGIIEASKCGFSSLVPEGTGVSMLGAYRCKVGNVIANANNGYGLTLGRNNQNPSVGSAYNAIGNIVGDAAGASVDSDPGLSIAGGSSFNYVGNIYFKDYAHCCVIGEDSWPQPLPAGNPLNINVNNYIPSVSGVRCPYTLLILNIGKRNRFDTMTSRNCWNSDTAASPALVSFNPEKTTTGNNGATRDGSWCKDNFVGYIDHATERFNVTGATNASPIVITIDAQPHTFETGDTVVVSGVGGNTNANGTWVVTNVSHTTFSLNGSTGNAAYTSGGLARYRQPTHIVGTTTNATNNRVGRVIHRGHFDTALFTLAGDASNIIPSDSPNVCRRVTADRTTTSTTAGNVTDMAFYVDASEIWSFEFDLKAACSGAGGTKFALTFPAGANLTATVTGPSGASTTITEEAITVSGTLTTAVFNVSNASGWAQINGVIENGTTAGSVQLQFAAGTATQTSTVSQRSSLTAQQTY